MKYILIASVLLLLLTLQGCGRVSPSSINTNVAQQESSNDPITLVRVENGKGEYVSKPYGFSIVFDNVFSARLDLQMKTEHAHTILIERPNTDTREDAHRDTPNGSNTAGEDRVLLTIASNTDLLSSRSAESDFLKWHSVALPSQAITQITPRTVGDRHVLFAHEEDGAGGSVGQYFYVFGTQYIISVGSDDVPQSELFPIVESVKF